MRYIYVFKLLTLKSIFIICGDKGSGKSTFLKDILSHLRTDGFVFNGFVALHHLESDSYVIKNLITNEESLIMQRSAGFEKRPNHFKIFPDGVENGNIWIDGIIKQSPNIAVIDEIGGFELQGKLWHDGLTRILESDISLIFTVKTKHLDEVIKKWKIHNAVVFNTADSVDSKMAYEKVKGSLLSDITGVILAGGQSSRMGFNKADAVIAGESMLFRMIEKVQEVTSKIILSTGSLTYSGIPWPQIPDVHFQCGPMGGIYSALNVSSSVLNLIVSCDIPLVSASLLKYIVSQAVKSSALITIPVDCTGQQQMLCGVYHRNLLPVLEQQINLNQLKMKSLLNLVPVEFINISKDHPLYQVNAFTNVNTIDSLQQAQNLWNNL